MNGRYGGDKQTERYSDRDLAHAAEFRNEIHKEALAIARKSDPKIKRVIDRYPVEAYFQQHWDYPGAWYPIVAIPEDVRSRKALIDLIAADTLAHEREKKRRPFFRRWAKSCFRKERQK